MITLHIFLSRSYCCILDVKNALDTIAEAEKLSIADERLNIMVLGARQSILFLSPNGFHKAKELFDKGVKDSAILIDTALAVAKNIEVEYAEIVSMNTFEKVDTIENKALMLIAARVNSNGSMVRLIDNIEL